MFEWDNKQKGLLVLTCLALAFLGYQVYALLHHKALFQPLDEKKVPHTRVVIKPKHTRVHPAPVVPKKPQHVPTVSPPPAMHGKSPLLDASQKSYLKMLNQYELAHMKHQLLDEEVAVASVEKKLAAMRRRNGLLSPVRLGGSHGVLHTSSVPMPYRLSYIEQQQGKWMAMLMAHQQYKQVHVGMQLPHRFKVVDIDHEGVLLSQDEKRWRLNFEGATRLVDVQAFGVQSTKTLMRQLQPKKAATRKANLRALLSKKKSVKPRSLRSAVKPKKLLPRIGPFAVEMADEYEGDNWTHLPLNLTLMPVKLHPVVEGPLQPARLLLPEHPRLPSHYHILSAHDPKSPVYAVESSDGPSSPQKKPARHSQHYSQQARRILSMPTSSYMIQLMGSEHDKTVHQFITLNRLDKYVLDLALKNRDTPWHVVLYGQYPTFSDAKKALLRLPEYLQSGAWVREVRDLKRRIRSARIDKGYS